MANTQINISENGTKTLATVGKYCDRNIDVNVDVPAPEPIAVVRTVTVSTDVTGAPTIQLLLTGDEFIKKHYADDGFSATLIPVTPVASATGVVHFNYHGNRNIGSTNKAQTGCGLRSSSASAIGLTGFTAKINGTGYGQQMRVNSSGNLYQYLHTGYILKAGTYAVVLTSAE